jgi:hypothetical protein
MDVLKFTPYSWAKLVFLRDLGKTEVGFMALTKRPDLNRVIDVLMPPQECSSAYTEFKEEGLAEFFEKMVDKGHHPEEFGRIWCHTHPFESPTPSGTDETTFTREFSGPDWAIMFIVGTSGKTSCRLRWRSNPAVAHIIPGEKCTKELDIAIDYRGDFPGTDKKAWEEEYKANWSEKVYTRTHNVTGARTWNSATREWEDYKPYSSVNTQGTWRPGPGYRWTRSNTVMYCKRDEIEDLKNGIKDERDWARKYGDYYEVKSGRVKLIDINGTLQLPFQNRTKSSPVEFYRNGRQLTKREKKYLKKHGTLEGFQPPVNPGFKEKAKGVTNFVKTEKLETNRNLLEHDPYLFSQEQWEQRWAEQDESDGNWLDETAEQWLAKQREEDETHPDAKFWTIVLTGGERIYNVLATTATNAMNFTDEDLADIGEVECSSYAVPQKTGKLIEEEWDVTRADGTIHSVLAYDEVDAINKDRLECGFSPYYPKEEELLANCEEEPTDEELKQIAKEEADELQLLDEPTPLEGVVLPSEAEDHLLPYHNSLT